MSINLSYLLLIHTHLDNLTRAATKKLQTHFGFGKNFARNTHTCEHKHKSVDINKTKQNKRRNETIFVLGEFFKNSNLERCVKGNQLI